MNLELLVALSCRVRGLKCQLDGAMAVAASVALSCRVRGLKSQHQFNAFIEINGVALSCRVRGLKS